MGRISKMIIGAAASTALLGGIGGAALAAGPAQTAPTRTTAATAIEYGLVNVPTCDPTAVEYAVPGCS